ncbi:MAG TPA: hypothetical protein VKX25_08325 [Bryobacteraceae bacterium]|jgi:hypothetical protein|nr:hypothetical protein [Bryobacteraceae bacterium]
MLDVKRLIGEVAAQNGIRLEPGDPAFALVTLNQLVLEETAKRVCDHVSVTLAKFTESLSRGEHLAGRAMAQEIKAVAADIRTELAADLQKLQSATGAHPVNGSSYVWLAIGALTGAASTAAGFALYRMMAG